MALVKISRLPSAGPLAGSEPVPVVQAGVTAKTTAQDIADLASVPTLPLAIADGGSGQTTAQAALDAYFATVAKGTLVVGDGTHNTPVAVGANGDVLTADSGQPNGVKWAAVAGGGVSIGDAIGGGTAQAVLFLDAGGNLSDSSRFFVDAFGGLTVQQGNTTPTGFFFNTNTGTSVRMATNMYSLLASVGAFSAALATPALAASFTDGVRTVTICDGSNNVSYTAGTPADWSPAAPTDVWLALDRVVAWIAANFPIPPPP